MNSKVFSKACKKKRARNNITVIDSSKISVKKCILTIN